MEAPKKTARTRKGKSSSESASAPSAAAAPVVSGPLVVSLPADLRIGAAADIYRELLASDPSRPVSLDASAVTKVDAAGMQAVLAGLRPRQGPGNWTWTHPAEAFLRAARILGLQQHLALPS